MKKIYFSFLLSLLVCVIHHAEDNSEPEMTEIKKYQDVEPFAGRMVAVASDNYCINHKEREVESTVFGYVNADIFDWIAGGDGYLLNRVIEKNTASSYAILNDETIKKSVSIKVRLATYNEILKLKKGIEENTLIFERVRLSTYIEENTLTLESFLMYLEEAKERRITEMLDANIPVGSNTKPVKR